MNFFRTIQDQGNRSRIGAGGSRSSALLGETTRPDRVELWNNDYLSLRGHAAIVQAQVDLLTGGSDDLYMSAAYLGDGSSQRALELQMARFLGTEDAVLCQSGWCAAVGLIQTVADKETPVYIDTDAHASLWDGARSAEAPTHGFAHNDTDDLERLIREHGPGIVAVEAIYGASGSIGALAEILAVAENHGCETVVDESHSIGVIGQNGQGLVSLLGLSDKVTYRSFSLSKCFVARVGMVAGPARVMEFFRYESRPAIFSSAVLPHEVAGLRAALEVIQEEDWRRRLLMRNIGYVSTALSDVGYDTAACASPIIMLRSGREDDIGELFTALEEHGVVGALLSAPAVPEGSSALRLILNCGLNDEHLDRVVAACADVQARPLGDRVAVPAGAMDWAPRPA